MEAAPHKSTPDLGIVVLIADRDIAAYYSDIPEATESLLKDVDFDAWASGREEEKARENRWHQEYVALGGASTVESELLADDVREAILDRL